MAAQPTPAIRTICSGDACRIPITLTFDASGPLATAHIPGNGRRGAARIEAATRTVDVGEEHDGVLLVWDCPACGYADSYDRAEG